MIPVDRVDVLEAGMAMLESYARRSGARGRLITLYLGLRRMGNGIAPLGGVGATRSRVIEEFMDAMLTKLHRPEPLVVLTAPFGGSVSPWSTRTGETAPTNKYATNTWRNNFGIQKGVGCPAEPGMIEELLDAPSLRLACPHMAIDPDGHNVCSLEGTEYRGEEQSIWLRKAVDGWQVADLDHPATYSMYLTPPGGDSIPIFALIAVFYCDAPAGVYPARRIVGIPDFAEDFGFSVDQVEEIFNCDPTDDDNDAVLRVAHQRIVIAPLIPPAQEEMPIEPLSAIPKYATELPALPEPVLANSGLGAELDVAKDLVGHGWDVSYRGSQTGVGYDLEAVAGESTLCVEVKSSVSFTTPELTESEWKAACDLGEQFVLAVVDFYGSSKQTLWYVRNPAAAAAAAATPRASTIYRLPRSTLFDQGVDADFL